MISDTSQSFVLQQIVARLRAALSLDERSCYVSLSRWLSPKLAGYGGPYWIVVVPGEGRYDESYPAGGGAQQILERAQVEVAACTRIRLDQAEHADALFTDTTRGLLELKRQILQALAGHDLLGQDLGGGEYARILTQYLAPVAAGPAEYDPGSGIATLGVTFTVEFSWQL